MFIYSGIKNDGKYGEFKSVTRITRKVLLASFLVYSESEDGGVPTSGMKKEEKSDEV